MPGSFSKIRSTIVRRWFLPWASNSVSLSISVSRSTSSYAQAQAVAENKQPSYGMDDPAGAWRPCPTPADAFCAAMRAATRPARLKTLLLPEAPTTAIKLRVPTVSTSFP